MSENSELGRGTNRLGTPELVWPGKYDDVGNRKEVSRASLPFQIIERVNESRATREARKSASLSLFDVYEGDEGSTFEDGWSNKLIWGDNFYVLGSLLDKFAGKVDLIYIDPPFATGADFSFVAEVGDGTVVVPKEQSLVEEKAYRDTWGAGLASYLDMMWPRLVLMRDMLSDTGSIFVHCDWHVGYLLRSLLDEAFGADNFLNEIVWYYYNKFQGNVNHFAANHDVILWYRKGKKHRYKALKEKRPEGTVQQIKRRWDSEKGRIVNVKGPDGKVVYQETDERTVDDVWRISMLQPADRTQNVGYPTQKPKEALRRVIEAASEPGDLVADFFCGSGTALVVSEELERRWIGCDLGRWGVHVSRKRLLEVPNCKPFEVLNLGRYECQSWQGAAFGNGRQITERTLYEYIAFVLKLYSAEPISGSLYLHGRRGQATIHVGSVDAPVTINEVVQALEECATLGQKELHVLGWEWEMGLSGPNANGSAGARGGLMQEEARRLGVRLLLLQIPREVMEQQAVDRGDVRFFELAYLEVALEKPDGPRSLRVRLEDFVVPNTELIPQEVREKVEKWSDYVDYWAVDWDFRNDSFTQGWVAYRTRRDRSLPLISDMHEYESPGVYKVAVKAIDVFGNDTTRVVEVEVG